MEGHETEDMLFGFPSSQNSLDSVNEDGDFLDELSDEKDDSEFDDLWDAETSQELFSAQTLDEIIEEDILDELESIAPPDEVLKNIAHRTVKDRNWVIARVEGLIEGILDGLLAGDSELSITLKTTAGISRRVGYSSKQKECLPQPKARRIKFPGSNEQEAWRFTVLVKIIELVHACLVQDVVASKRDLYYRHPDLFVKQSVVDRFIDDLACTFGVPRSLLNVTAAAKGLVAGNFTLTRANGTVIYGLSDNEGVLLPNINGNDTLDVSSLQWIIIIEKEATFRHLLNSSVWSNGNLQTGLLLTAKGYPDVASRIFLHHVAERAPDVPMFALVDYDPDGIAIMSTYKYGSHRLAHEHKKTDEDTPGPNLPNLHWLGVHSHHLFRGPRDEQDPAMGRNQDAQGLMRLTPRDRTKACRMLEWDICSEDGPEPEWRRELQRMLMLNIKAEIQILEESSGGIVSCLEGGIAAVESERELLV